MKRSYWRFFAVRVNWRHHLFNRFGPKADVAGTVRRS